MDDDRRPTTKDGRRRRPTTTTVDDDDDDNCRRRRRRSTTTVDDADDDGRRRRRRSATAARTTRGFPQVQSCWNEFLRGAESREAAGEAIYAAVFDAAPSLQSLFKTPRAVMAMRFMNGLNQIIASLLDPRGMKVVVETLAFQHLDLDVTIPRTVIFRDAIVDLLAVELGARFNKRAREGWSIMLNYTGGAYISGGARAADRLVHRLPAELLSVQGRLASAEDALDSLADGREAAQRARALLPALLAKLEGRPPSLLETLRRNVALHASAEGVGVLTASAAVLRRVQHWPRLEARLGVARSGLRAGAADFVTGAGRWQPLPEAEAEAVKEQEGWHAAGVKFSLDVIVESDPRGGPPRPLPPPTIYTRTKFADRLKILASSWATANNKKEDEFAEVVAPGEGEEEGEEKDEKEKEAAASGNDNNQDVGSKMMGNTDGPSAKKKKKGSTKKKRWGFGGDKAGGDAGAGHEAKSMDDSEGGSFRNTSVPTTYTEMFFFNAAVMGFGQSTWMNEVLASFDTIVTNVANSYRLQEECDVLALRIAKYKGSIAGQPR
ncbi:unnamed protein product, partial [Prorocentrum cordatum]